MFYRPLFFILIMLLLQLNLIGQTTDCSLFCVTDIQMDSTTANSLNVTILSSDSSSNHINYPSISAVITSTGDTIASNSNLQFFAHIGGTSQTYPINTILDSIPANFTCTVILHYNDLFGNGDTSCILNYPCVVTSTSELPSKIASLAVYPNPASYQTTISFDAPLVDDYTINIFDSQGKLVWKKIKIQTSFIVFDTNKLAAGLYFIQLTQAQYTIGTTKLVVE